VVLHGDRVMPVKRMGVVEVETTGARARAHEPASAGTATAPTSVATALLPVAGGLAHNLALVSRAERTGTTGATGPATSITAAGAFTTKWGAGRRTEARDALGLWSTRSTGASTPVCSALAPPAEGNARDRDTGAGTARFPPGAGPAFPPASIVAAFRQRTTGQASVVAPAIRVADESKRALPAEIAAAIVPAFRVTTVGDTLASRAGASLKNTEPLITSFSDCTDAAEVSAPIVAALLVLTGGNAGVALLGSVQPV